MLIIALRASKKKCLQLTVWRWRSVSISFLASNDNLLASGLLQPVPQELVSPASPPNSVASPSKFSDLGFGSPAAAIGVAGNATGMQGARLFRSDSETERAAVAGGTGTTNTVHVVVAISEDITVQFQNNLQQKLEIVGTVTITAKQQQPAVGEAGGATPDTNGHDNRMSLVLRMNDSQSQIGPCQLNPQVEAAGKKECNTVRLVRCRIPNAAEPLPVMKYKCAPEFRPALLRTRSALQVRDTTAKITIEVRKKSAFISHSLVTLLFTARFCVLV